MHGCLDKERVKEEESKEWLILNLISTCESSPHTTKQFFDTSWVSYSLTQFQHDPELELDPTGWGLSPTGLPPAPPLLMPVANPNCHLLLTDRL